MGSINHGTQSVSHRFYEEMTANNRNARLVDILSRGIYSGGYLKRVSDVEIQLTAAVVEIGDNNVEVRVKTASDATINDSTIDSGSISPSTPFIVLRWGYATTQVNYMEVHAIATVGAALANDIIVGRILFSGSVITGFNYSDRTILNVQNLFLRPVVSEDSEMYIRVRSGRLHTNSACVTVSDQKAGPFVAPSAPNSRIDLVYIDDAGVAQILQGTPAVSPSSPDYGGRLVVAEVTVTNGAVSIAESNIRDVRSFLTRRGIQDGSVTVSKLNKYDSGWFAIGTNTTYTKVHGLSSEPSLVSLQIAEFSDGSGRRAVQDCPNYTPDIGTLNTSVCKVDSSEVKIRTGFPSVTMLVDANGVLWAPATAYARIIAIG